MFYERTKSKYYCSQLKRYLSIRVTLKPVKVEFYYSKDGILFDCISLPSHGNYFFAKTYKYSWLYEFLCSQMIGFPTHNAVKINGEICEEFVLNIRRYNYERFKTKKMG